MRCERAKRSAARGGDHDYCCRREPRPTAADASRVPAGDAAARLVASPRIVAAIRSHAAGGGIDRRQRLRRARDRPQVVDEPRHSAHFEVALDLGARRPCQRVVGVFVERRFVRMHITTRTWHTLGERCSAETFADGARRRGSRPQHRAQLHARLEHLRLRRAFRDPEQLAHFLVIEPFDVVEHERFTASGRQPFDGAIEIDPCNRRVAPPDRLDARSASSVSVSLPIFACRLRT